MNSNFPTKNVEDYLVCARGDELPDREIFALKSEVIHFKFLILGTSVGVGVLVWVYGSKV